MSTDPGNLDSQSFFARVKSILLRPQSTWEAIAAEPDDDTLRLYKGYAVPLAALSALCLALGLFFFRWGGGAFAQTLNPVQALISGLFQFVVILVSIAIMGVVINALAPRFGGTANSARAHKVAVYAATAALLAGVFSLHPMLSILGLLSFYSLGLLFIGLPRLMPTPDEKRVPYFATVLGVSIVASLVVYMILGAVRTAALAMVAGLTFGEQPAEAPPTEIGVLGSSIDLRDLEKQAREYARSGPVADPARLQEQLPQTLPGGFRLTTSSSNVALGVAQAEAEYANGDARIVVTLVHMGATGSVAAVAEAADMRADHRDADGFARTESIDGRVYSEQVSTSTGSATYAVVGRGIALTAVGTGGVTSDQVRAAVETISIQRLEREFGG